MTWSYEFDNASNRTRRSNDWASVTYAYDEANELCWWVWAVTASDCSSIPSGAKTYDHDANGDLVSASTGLAASYNVARQTVEFRENSAADSTTFEYAGQGQRERTEKNDFVFVDSVLGVSAEKRWSYYKSYVRDNAGTLVGMRTDSPRERYYYLRDALGSIVALVDDQGQVVRRLVYNDPYGDDVTSQTLVSGAPSNGYRFAGEYRDAETGLYKIGERYYHPNLGRWTQKDPLMQAFSPREANGYTYAGADPINLTDPSGMHMWDPTGAVSDAWDSTVGRLDWGDAADVGFAISNLGTAAAGALAFGGVATGCAAASWATAGVATPFLAVSCGVGLTGTAALTGYSLYSAGRNIGDVAD